MSHARCLFLAFLTLWYLSWLQNATLFFINFSLVSCILLLGSLAVSGGVPPDVVPHLAVVAFFALGLLVSVNWVVRQTGTVSPEDQRKEIFGEETPAAKKAA